MEDASIATTTGAKPNAATIASSNRNERLTPLPFAVGKCISGACSLSTIACKLDLCIAERIAQLHKAVRYNL